MNNDYKHKYFVNAIVLYIVIYFNKYKGVICCNDSHIIYNAEDYNNTFF